MEIKVKTTLSHKVKTFAEAVKETGRQESQIRGLIRLRESDPKVIDYALVNGKKVLVLNDRYKAMVKRFKAMDKKKLK